MRVAEQRTQRAVDAIHSLSNCASRVCYDYTPEQVEQIIAALEAEIRRLQSAFTGENVSVKFPRVLFYKQAL